jgi:signal transduction histidine kinase
MTVRLRVTLGASVVFALALTLGAGFLVTRQRAALTREVDTTIRLRADDIVAALKDSSLPSSVAIPYEERSFVQIVDGRGTVVRSSPNVEGEPPIAASLTRVGVHTLDRTPLGTGPFRVIAEPATVGGSRLTVYVGLSLDTVDVAVRDLTVALAGGAPFLLGLAALMTWVAIGRALRPVDQIRAEVASIGERELHRRVLEPATGDEIGRLALTMNSMLDRLEDAAARQRRFLADASHELRSPLTGIRSQLEVDLAHPDQADWHATEADVLAETLRMQRLVDDLLALARGDGDLASQRDELIDVDDVVLAEARRLKTRGKVAVDARRVGSAQVMGDPDALGRVVRNLVDNAERHAVETVTLAVTDDDVFATITVGDDGPGVAPGDRDRVFERFARADGARDRDRGGSGLGLAIARDLVAAHGGTLELLPADGGATFIVRLPHQPAGSADSADR